MASTSSFAAYYVTLAILYFYLYRSFKCKMSSYVCFCKNNRESFFSIPQEFNMVNVSFLYRVASALHCMYHCSDEFYLLITNDILTALETY